MYKKPWEAYLPSILELLALAAQSKSLPLIEKDDRGQLVRDLYDHWVELGGRNAGHPIRSVRQMREWLGSEKAIRSLEPKLSGRTNLRRDDATILIELFLKRWHPGERVDEERPYVDGDLSGVIDRVLDAFYPAREPKNEKGFLLPDTRGSRKKTPNPATYAAPREVGEIIDDLFEKSNALITVSRISTVSDTPESIRRFQELMDLLRDIDSHDDKKRLLIWIVDIGKRNFSDSTDLLALRNMDALAFQFRALTLTEHNERRERWNWLTDRAIFIIGNLHNTDVDRCYQNINIDADRGLFKIPWFNSGLLLLNETPDNWASSRELRILYGAELERLPERTFTVHVNLDGWALDQKGKTEHEKDLRYFGYEPPKNDSPSTGSNEPRHSIELPRPSRRHNEAFWLAYAAASFRAGLMDTVHGGFSPIQSLSHLRHHNFAVLKLAEFLEISKLIMEN